MFDNARVLSANVINVLVVLFDFKVQLSHYVSQAIFKSNKALNVIKPIRRFFNSKELIQLLTSNFFSILYYNSEGWHLPALHQNIKKSLIAASSGALKMALHYPKYNISCTSQNSIT
jgi:hypothetical protein